MWERLDRFVSAEGERHAERFRPRNSDVIVATYPKSGTTWMQQIVHGLRSNGSMAFSEISEVIPWIELAHDLGQDLEADHANMPRVFKSHKNADDIQRGCRYIAVIRDPKNVAVSFYHFFQGWFFEPGSITLDEFVREFFFNGSDSGRYWPHLVSWWRRRCDPDTLFFCYEDMVADLPGTVSRVAAFLGFADRTAAIDIATRQASIAFMRRHARQFDEHLTRDARDAACGLPRDGAVSKVGTAENREALTPALSDFLDGVWREEIEPLLGFACYDELRESLAKP